MVSLHVLSLPEWDVFSHKTSQPVVTGLICLICPSLHLHISELICSQHVSTAGEAFCTHPKQLPIMPMSNRYNRRDTFAGLIGDMMPLRGGNGADEEMGRMGMRRTWPASAGGKP